MTFVGIVAKQKEFEILQTVMKKNKDINIILITHRKFKKCKV